MRQETGGYLQNFKSIPDTYKTKRDRSAQAQLHNLYIVEIQAMIYNVARVRRLFTNFQVDTCKSKEDGSAHAQLRTL